MRGGLSSFRLLWIVVEWFAVCAQIQHVEGVKADLCAGGSGVVKASRSASLGAKILTKCGRNMVLKYTLTPKQFHKILTKTCIVTRLCYARINVQKNTEQFQEQITNCYIDASRWIVRAIPTSFHRTTTSSAVTGTSVDFNKKELFSEDIWKDVEPLTASIKKCLVNQMPKDQDTMLGIVRYLRMFFFTA
ncbi:uncharacterized protein [Dermacentor andersoni]|uniref:uncharacterized protein isoform X1 n=1 Tax=Dermacentor andersoni TaxID=34620 RepID=UPI002416D6D3|nr:uncharacterized protein LOC126542186 isoform X1 [Dermacentor andersoni]